MCTVEYFTAECKICRLNRRPVRKTGVQRRTQAVYAVPSRTQTARFFSPKINPCEIHEDFHCKPNALHCPVIHHSVKLLHRNAVYSTVPHDLTQNDEADRVLLHTGYHGQKSERICSIADFSPTSTPVSPIRNHTTRNYGGKN